MNVIRSRLPTYPEGFRLPLQSPSASSSYLTFSNIISLHNSPIDPTHVCIYEECGRPMANIAILHPARPKVPFIKVFGNHQPPAREPKPEFNSPIPCRHSL